jgi:hypothetical protein
MPNGLSGSTEGFKQDPRRLSNFPNGMCHMLFISQDRVRANTTLPLTASINWLLVPHAAPARTAVLPTCSTSLIFHGL